MGHENISEILLFLSQFGLVIFKPNLIKDNALFHMPSTLPTITEMSPPETKCQYHNQGKVYS